MNVTSIETENPRQKTYARFGDFRTQDRDNYTTEPNTAERQALYRIGKQCWENRETLSSEDQSARRGKRQEIASHALQFLKKPVEGRIQPYDGPQDPGSLIAEHLVDLATLKSRRGAFEIASNRLNVRSATLKAVGRNDILKTCRASELVLSAVISELTPHPPPSAPMAV